MKKSRKVEKIINTIYLIRSNLTNKVYVGQTWMSLEARFTAHKRCAKRRVKRHSVKLHNSMRKYGFENFFIEKLAESSTQEEANELEDFYILKFDSINKGLNLKRGGAAGDFSEETRKKMSKSARGNKSRAKLTEQQVQEIRALLLAKTMQQKDIASKYGVHKSTITKLKTGKNWVSDENH